MYTLTIRSIQTIRWCVIQNAETETEFTFSNSFFRVEMNQHQNKQTDPKIVEIIIEFIWVFSVRNAMLLTAVIDDDYNGFHFTISIPIHCMRDRIEL